MVDGENVVPEVHAVLDQMAAFRRSGPKRRWPGHTGKRIRNVSQHRHRRLGSRACDGYKALKYYSQRDLTFRFVSNVDGTDFVEATRDLSAEETLFIVCSKTFTTLETMTNAHTARNWVLDALAIRRRWRGTSSRSRPTPRRSRSSASTPPTCSVSGTGSAAGTRWTRQSASRR